MEQMGGEQRVEKKQTFIHLKKKKRKREKEKEREREGEKSWVIK